jgi:hypothetical protein
MWGQKSLMNNWICLPTWPLPPSRRSAFLEAVSSRLATYSSDAIGLGSHRVAREIQHDFLKSGQVAVGPVAKYGAPTCCAK